MPSRSPAAPIRPSKPNRGYSQPLVLWGQTIVSPNSDQAIPNVQLANPNGLPIEILEVRVRLQPWITAANAFVALTGMTVGLKMDLGSVPVVDGYVPVSLFGGVRDTHEDQGVMFANGASSVLSYPSTYQWRLKYPLFVPAGGVLTCAVAQGGQSAFPTKVDVSYICRTWDPRRPEPVNAKVPWASRWISKSFDLTANDPAGADASSALDLRNPFNVPLELSRLAGRVALGQNQDPLMATTANAIVEDPYWFRSNRSTIRLRSSRGHDLIRTPVAFDGVFPLNWRAWELPEGWSMAPREYYAAKLDIAADAITFDPGERGVGQFAMGLVGYRDVPVSALKPGATP